MGFDALVYAHDPSVVYPQNVRKNVQFFNIGVCKEERKLFGKPCKTLQDIIQSNGHLETKITYLKVDIEREEIEAIPQWLQSGAMVNVQQFGVEIHQNQRRPISYMMKLMRDLQVEEDFRVINHQHNLVHLKDELFEIVFKRIDQTFSCAA